MQGDDSEDEGEGDEGGGWVEHEYVEGVWDVEGED